MECYDDDIKIYRKYSYDELKKYVDLYIQEYKQGIDFVDLFKKCHHYLSIKKWLLKELHKRDNTKIYETVEVNDMINDYTMHLLMKFFVLDYFDNMFIFLEENFIENYVRNESVLEGVNDLNIHGKNEMLGLEEMYKYLVSAEEKSSTGCILLTDLHEKLFSHFDGGAYSRIYRREMAYLPYSGIELEEPIYIPRKMRESDRLFEELCVNADTIRNCDVEDKTFIVEIYKDGKSVKTTAINAFLEKVMKYNAELVRIHPFPDGNGRSIRGIVNYLFMRAGLPPVYIKTVERKKYHEAMNKAIVENNYELLVNFYKNKLCDSIEELVVEPFEKAIHQYKKQRSKLTSCEQEGSNLQRLFNPELIRPKNHEFEKEKEKYISLDDYLLTKEANRKYESNVNILFNGKRITKKTFGTVIKENNATKKKQEGSNVLRLLRKEENKNRM